MNRREFLTSSGLAALYLALPGFLSACGIPRTAAEALATPETWATPVASPTSLLTGSTNSAAFVHLLNRITYGPRAGDLEQASKLGWDAIIERQLHPDQIDDTALDQQLKSFTTLNMSGPELAAIARSLRQNRRDKKNPTIPTPEAESTNPADLLTGTSTIKPARIVAELQAAAILRAIASERQLYEIMVDFWSNHLNIFIGKGLVRFLKTLDDREVIRAHALGTFREMLLASARSPAMLLYLDNAQNTRPLGARGGINENYGRELLELHTVGADGGYSQDDVIAVARTLTGWTVAPAQAEAPGTFLFAPRLHDPDEKRIEFLGLNFPAGGGQAEGEELLSRLATHPKTAERIAYKLVATFVSDTPPPALVARAVQAYLANDTDIRTTLGVILHSDEFRQAADLKIKLPFRMLVSAIRATGTTPNRDGLLSIVPLVKVLQGMGQAPFGWSPPNGYPQIGAAWVTTGGLLARWNFGLNLAAGQIRGLRTDLTKLVPQTPTTPAALVDALARAILPGALTPEAHAALTGYVGKPDTTLNAQTLRDTLPGLVGLMLASPAFQVY